MSAPFVVKLRNKPGPLIPGWIHPAHVLRVGAGDADVEETCRHAHPAEEPMRENEREKGVAGLGGVSYQIRALTRQVFTVLDTADKTVPWLTPYSAAYLYGVTVGYPQTFQTLNECLSGERRRATFWPTLAATGEFQ